MVSRSVRAIAHAIKSEWHSKWNGTLPVSLQYAEVYLNRLCVLTETDDASETILRFCFNASTWHGETARELKTELKIYA